MLGILSGENVKTFSLSNVQTYQEDKNKFYYQPIHREIPLVMSE